ncbi:hypothetical protein [Methylovirgula sp. HY1]|uniref:hypothetical protein n=1 Tax=Methylovirgula sp. HY1 TaxID=2822761 RepID=UPI001C5ABB98|nr:hypothetical protein [Methylovirgula sp. HY1]QXX74276.1 hypothetical protein MHY1_01086 [Methylovirgula sp. HY1]
MKALTVWQPWASLIAIGAKPYEFRGWPVPRSLIDCRIAIHAGARPIKRDEIADLIYRLRAPEGAWTTALKPEIALPWLEWAHANPHLLPRAAIVATAIIGLCKPAYEIIHEFGAVVGDSDRREHMNRAWPLGSIERQFPTVPARGAQGFWNWSQSEPF